VGVHTISRSFFCLREGCKRPSEIYQFFDCQSSKHCDLRPVRGDKQALKAVADSLRDEVDGEDVRFTTIFPGLIATQTQVELHRAASKLYRPDRLMEPGDVAGAVLFCPDDRTDGRSYGNFLPDAKGVIAVFPMKAVKRD
jgi:hypothetical protein